MKERKGKDEEHQKEIGTLKHRIELLLKNNEQCHKESAQSKTKFKNLQESIENQKDEFQKQMNELNQVNISMKAHQASISKKKEKKIKETQKQLDEANEKLMKYEDVFQQERLNDAKVL